MTIKEMHASVLLKVDRDNDFLRNRFVVSEIDDFINEAQREFVNQNRRFLREYTPSRKGAEAHEALRTLIESESVNTVSSHSELERGFEINLSNLSQDYDYFISARVHYPTEDHWKTTRIVNRAFINDRSTTLYHQKPVYSETPVHIDNDTLIGLYDVEDTEIPDKLEISYLRQPRDVAWNPNSSDSDVDSEIPEDFHRDIVDIATRKIIGSLAGQQGQNQEN